MNHYAIFIQSYNSYLNGALFHHNGQAGRQFLVPLLARAFRQVSADAFRAVPRGQSAYGRFIEQYERLDAIREELGLDPQQCDLEFERQMKSDHYGEFPWG